MKIKSIAFLAFLVIGTFAGCEDKGAIPKDIAVSSKPQAQKAPAFNLVTSSSKAIKITAAREGWTFQGLEGKIVLLDFFGTWCPPCKAEIPHLNEIRNNLKDKFEIIGVDIGPRGGGVTPKDELDKFIEDFKIKYPVTTSADNRKLYSALSELNPNGSIPFMILFNTKGIIAQYYIGMQPKGLLQSDIDKILK